MKPSQSEPADPRGRVAGDGALRRLAYERIEDLLNGGCLKPGELYSQRELVDLTGATLGSVREAIPRFEAEGLLLAVPKKGLMVPSLDVRFVREAYQVRAMIERAAVSDMMARRDHCTVEEWRERQRALAGELAPHGDAPPDELIYRIQREDWVMHAAFVRSMSNALLENIYRVTAIKIRMAVQSRLKVTGRNAVRILREHADFLDRIAARDADGAIAALDRHIGNSLHLALGGTLEGGDRPDGPDLPPI
jgi:DNA-binding GntR family transcriptional regulator